jgi:PLD-like domain
VLELSSRGALLAALGSARRVDLAAYTLESGRLLDALGAAAERGADVRVSLEGGPYARDSIRATALREQNEATAARLRAHGVRVRLAHEPDAPLHLKAAVVDAALFLDDRNWPGGGDDTIVRTTARSEITAARAAIAGREASTPEIALRKDRALGDEARLIERTRGDRIDCESESFSASPVMRALLRAARRGRHVRLLVAARELSGGGSRAERSALWKLRQAGVDVRTGDSDEKFCVTKGSAWLGSANATAGEPHTIDWGARTRRREVVALLERRFESNWRAAGKRVGLPVP